MKPKIIYLFPDTNLLIQCRSLHEITWEEMLEFSEVRLIITMPVQREIDAHKNKGNDRLNKRARSATTLLRKIILSSDGFMVIREQNPRVVISVDSRLKWDKALSEELDYEERDDQLVGIISEYRKINPNNDSRLLTHDTTPLSTAQSVGIEAIVIPDAWLLPPENSRIEKELAALRKENENLKRAGPMFEVFFMDPKGERHTKYERRFTKYNPLTSEQLSTMFDRLKELRPCSNDFGPPDASAKTQRQSILGPLERIEFIPANEEDIERYIEHDYPNWLSQCRHILENCHKAASLAVGFNFEFYVLNSGSRPARDALITIVAEGDFELLPDSDEQSESEVDAPPFPEVKLPDAPSPPHGSWRTTRLGNLLSAADPFGRFAPDPVDLHPYLGRYLDAGGRKIDPNGFYYKPEKPRRPVSSIKLECQQWRHGTSFEVFPGKIIFEHDRDKIEGALLFRIEAENLAQPAELRVPVSIVADRSDIYDEAAAAVEKMKPFRLGNWGGKN